MSDTLTRHSPTSRHGQLSIMLDTNVLVSAFAFGGVGVEVLKAVLAGHRLVVARETLDELERVLVKKMATPMHVAREHVAFVGDHAAVVQAARPASWPRDPDDRWIVAAAVDHDVDMLVTGDAGILEVLQTELKTVSPRDFLDLLRRP